MFVSFLLHSFQLHLDKLLLIYFAPWWLQVYVIDAFDPKSGILRFCERISGVQYFLEHHDGFFYILTNAPLRTDELSNSGNYYLGRCRADNLHSTNLQVIISG